MPPKRPKKEEEPDDQFLKMPGQQLIKQLALKREKVNQIKSRRNYIQMDRDMVEQFYQNTLQQIDQVKIKIVNKQTQAQELETNHRADVKVFLQRMKHLEYQQQRANIGIESDGEEAKKKENQYFQKKIQSLKTHKQDFKKKYFEFEKKYIEDVQNLQNQHEERFKLNTKKYKQNMEVLQKKYKERVERLKEQLLLKEKVEIHQLQQRKNLHINQLMKNHQIAFAQLKAYNNDITSDNLRLIKNHKAEILKMGEEQKQRKKMIAELDQSNKSMQNPLQQLKKKKNQKMAKLKQFEKQKNSLQNYKSKQIVLKDKIFRLKKDLEDLDIQYKNTFNYKDQLENKFEKLTSEVKRHAQLNNLVLKQKLSSLFQQLQEKQAQLRQVVEQAILQPNVVMQISAKVNSALQSKNSMIRNLQYSIHHATKAYNDAIRVYETKLVQFGIPAQELGFEPMQTVTSTMPAGLVSS